MTDYAGSQVMQRWARKDARNALRELIEQPRGTHCGKATSDSIAYVAEVQRIEHEAKHRR